MYPASSFPYRWISSLLVRSTGVPSFPSPRGLSALTRCNTGWFISEAAGARQSWKLYSTFSLFYCFLASWTLCLSLCASLCIFCFLFCFVLFAYSFIFMEHILQGDLPCLTMTLFYSHISLILVGSGILGRRQFCLTVVKHYLIVCYTPELSLRHWCRLLYVQAIFLKLSYETWFLLLDTFQIFFVPKFVFSNLCSFLAHSRNVICSLGFKSDVLNSV